MFGSPAGFGKPNDSVSVQSGVREASAELDARIGATPVERDAPRIR